MISLSLKHRYCYYPLYMKSFRELRLNEVGSGAAVGFVAVIVLALVIGVAYVTVNKNSTKSTSSVNNQGSSSNLYKVLAPATVPPKVAECSMSVSYGSNGQPQPLTCPNGYINVTAWDSLATIEPKVMSLGYNVSASQVESAICSDVNAADADSSATQSAAIETEVYQISALYYGWNFVPSPSSILASGAC